MEDGTLVRELVVMNDPVMVAARGGHAKVVSVLLKYGGRPSGLDAAFEGRRHNALMVASQEGRSEVVEVLLREGKENPNYSALGTNALILAAHYHHLSVIKILDQYGADMNAKSADGSNALLETSRWTSHPSLIDYLVTRGVACDIEDAHGMTPLMYLANIGDLESIKILVEKGGANLAHAHTKDGQTVLSIAERRKMSEVVTYCWAKGMNPSTQAMQCHLGNLHVSRPRMPSSLGGRYNAATMAKGSKIFVYGGQASRNSSQLPVISPFPASEALDFPPPPSLSTHVTKPTSSHSKTESSKPSPNQHGDDHLSDDSDQHPAPNMLDENDDNSDLDIDEEDDDDGEQDPMAAQVDEAFRQFYLQVAQQARAEGLNPPNPNDILQNFIEALMNGEIDLAGIAVEIGNGRNVAPPQRPEKRRDANRNDEDGRGDDGEVASIGPGEPNSENQEKAASSAMDGDEMQLDDARSEISTDSSDYSSSESDGGDHDEFFIGRSSRTTIDVETYVLDVDSCEMEAIFPMEEAEEEKGKKKKKRRLDSLKEARLDERDEAKGKWMEVDADGLGGRTRNPPADASFPPCLAFSKKSFNARRGAFGYFEVTVINPGPRRLLTLGLVPPNYPKEGKQPGWNQGSFGLHGDDGALFCQAGSGDPFADRFEPGDVIGCGVYWPRKEVFFSVNGRFLGFAPVSVSSSRLYPCVGVRNEDAAFRINFGIEPFRFDFRAPTLRWKQISFASQLPSTAPAAHTPGAPPVALATQTTKAAATPQPRVSSPRFALHPNPSIFVLFSIESDASQRKQIYLFNNEKLVYLKRETTGAFPDPQAYSKLQPSSGRTPFEFCQPNPHNVFLFLPRTKTSPPLLGMFDTETLEWLDIGNAHDAFLVSRQSKFMRFSQTSNDGKQKMEGIEELEGQSQISPSEDATVTSNDPTMTLTGEASVWMELISALDAQEFEKCWFMSIDGKLVWTSESSYIVADASTGIYTIEPLRSKSVTLAQQATQKAFGDSAVCFAGWTGDSQLNDISIFRLSGGGWYFPTYSGIVPRPRNFHSAVLVHTKCAYFGSNASDLPSGLRLSHPKPVIINAFGWSGRNVMADLDVFSFTNAPSDFAINESFPSDITLYLQLVEENATKKDSASLANQVHLHDSSPSGLQEGQSMIQIKAHKILLFCRSSKFSELLASHPSSDAVTIHVESIDAFKGMLHFLYTDEIIRDPTWLHSHARKMALLFDVWAPELAPRVMERLLLTRSTLPNIFASQMLRGFDNPLFSDLTLRICPSIDDPSTSASASPIVFDLPVHKVIITSRSPYFKALCTGGMAESNQSVIEVTDVPFEALKLVIEFLYTYEVPYDRCSEHIVDMFTLASRFQISKLKSTLENLLIFNLQPDNVCDILLVAHSQSSTSLIRECVRFLDSHREEMLQDQYYLLLLPQINDIIAAFHQTPSNQSTINIAQL